MGSLSSHRFVSNDASQVCERIETTSNRRHTARLEIVQDKAREQERVESERAAQAGSGKVRDGQSSGNISRAC